MIAVASAGLVPRRNPLGDQTKHHRGGYHLQPRFNFHQFTKL
jgi:hypothetical protein